MISGLTSGFKILLASFLLTFISVNSYAGLHSYAENSVLATGKFVKIKIKDSGVYRLTYEDLSSMGLDPAKVSVFGYGGGVLNQSFLLSKNDDLPEIAVFENKGADGVFNAGDYILFYAQGVVTWTFDNSKQMFVHQNNPYANYGHYFLSSDAGSQKRIQDVTLTPPQNVVASDVETFTDYAIYEKELQSLARSGKEFYGETFSDVLSKSISFSFPNVVTTGNTIKTRLDVAAASSVNSSFSIDLSGQQSVSLSVSYRSETDHYEKAKQSTGIFFFTPLSADAVFNLTYQKTASTGVGYLNYLEVNALRKLTMTGAVMPFQQTAGLGSNTWSRYNLRQSSATVQVWNITNPLTTTRVASGSTGDLTSFYASNLTLNKFVAVNLASAASIPKPEVVGVVPNQNLHAMSPVDMVIITHPNFVSQSQKLADAHHEKDGLTVKVVTTEQVYNEFSSGTPDATAYRWMMKMLYDRAIVSGVKEDLPKYLLLFGRGSFDNRNVLPYTSESYVLTFQADNSLIETSSYVTDDYYGFLEDSEGLQISSHSLELGIGRIPAMTQQHADDVVDKIINYMNNPIKGNWKNQLCYLADDGDGALHMRQADSIASYMRRTFPSFQVNKIYLDAYQQQISASGETYPVARSQFHNLIQSGMMLLNYTGHAGPTGWTNEQILSVNDVKSMANTRLPLWVAATCDFVQFDIPSISAGEYVLLNPLGGGIGIISAARPVYASQNYTIDKLLNQNLFKKVNGKHPRIGDALRESKNAIGTEINKLCYVYMGDPALQLNLPTQYNIITSKINENYVAGNDTLRALSEATVSGYVVDSNGNAVTDFNGEIHAVIYDKNQKIITLNNDLTGSLLYYDRTNTLFSGKAEVKDGQFSVTFMLPKDIKYNFGTGRINYYAFNDASGDEAQGAFENFIVGGSNPDAVNDTEGPEMALYLNSSNFTNGGQVNETPLFFAHVVDNQGINRVGSGIGHDMILVVDEDPSQTYILNDYFESSLNTYTEGTVRYKLPAMSSGKHTLSFRVWDLMNNSNTQNIEFEVIKGLEPTIFSVRNYPNPVVNETRIVVDHDRPETIMKTTVDIFDLTGRIIWSFQQATADDIVWDVTGNDQNRVPTGIYLYRVSVVSGDNTIYSKMNKMLVVEQ